MVKKFTLMTAMTLLTGRLWALSVTPSIQNFELQPGEAIETEVVVANTEEETLNVVPTTKSWFVLPANRAFKIEEWLQLPPAPFVLKAGESKKLKVKIRVPKKATGELVGMLSFRTKSDTRTSVEFVMSVAIYVAVAGTGKVAGDIRAIMVSPSTDTVTAGVLLFNSGNVHLRPYGILEIYQDDGQLIANVELERGQPTYPGNQRPYTGTVKDLRLKPGKYTAQIELQDSDRRVLIDKRREKFVLKKDGKVEF